MSYLRYSPAAAKRLRQAFRELFTPTMTAVLSLQDGRDVRIELMGRVDDDGWRSAEFSYQPDEDGAIRSVALVNGRGETVAVVDYSPPYRFAANESPAGVYFDPLRLLFEVDEAGTPRAEVFERAAA